MYWADQRISVEEALWAVTRGAAYQYFEEDEKGSLSQWQRADLVVLAASPLAVAPGDLADIDIVETISAAGQSTRTPTILPIASPLGRDGALCSGCDDLRGARVILKYQRDASQGIY